MSINTNCTNYCSGLPRCSRFGQNSLEIDCCIVTNSNFHEWLSCMYRSQNQCSWFFATVKYWEHVGWSISLPFWGVFVQKICTIRFVLTFATLKSLQMASTVMNDAETFRINVCKRIGVVHIIAYLQFRERRGFCRNFDQIPCFSWCISSKFSSNFRRFELVGHNTKLYKLCRVFCD